MREIERLEVPISELRVHPKNLEVYWPHVDPEVAAKLEHEEEPALTAELAEAGELLNPIKIDTEDRILAGARRFVAGRAAGLTSLSAIRYQVDSDQDEWRIVLLDNRTRRDWPVVTRYREVRTLTNLYKGGHVSEEELRARAEEFGIEPTGDWAQDLAAAAVGWSKRTYHNVAMVMEDGRGPAEKLEELEESEAKEDFEERLTELRARVRRDELSPGGAYTRAKELKDEIDEEIQRQQGRFDEAKAAKERMERVMERARGQIESAADALEEIRFVADELNPEFEQEVQHVVRTGLGSLHERLQSLQSPYESLVALVEEGE